MLFTFATIKDKSRTSSPAGDKRDLSPLPTGQLSPIANQRGIALIAAISILAVMSVLGLILMSSSTTEIQLSGHFRNGLESFYTADRAITYVYRNGISTSTNVVDLYNDLDTTVNPAVLYRDRIAVGSGALEPSQYSANSDDRNSVLYIGTSPPPVGSGMDVNYFVARNYAISAVGIAPATAPNPSRTALRSQTSIIVPK